MPGLQADGVVAALGSPIKKSKLSLKFFQKKETKRALDFSETQAEEQNVQPQEAEEPARWPPFLELHMRAWVLIGSKSKALLVHKLYSEL